MREFDPLVSYPKLETPRYVGRNIRTIANRIRACYRGKDYYDGDRNDGFGGYKYDGRWKSVAQDFMKAYEIDPNKGKILQVGCDKGFLLHELKQLYPNLEVHGIEVSQYPIDNAKEEIKHLIQLGSFTQFPFADQSFDLVIGIGPVYALILSDSIRCLREIQRVSKGRSFVTLGSYETEEEYWLFRDWTLLGTTILRPDEWREVMKHAGFTGDYKFNSAQSLNLRRAES